MIKHTLRLNSPEAVFDIQTHANNANNTYVRACLEDSKGDLKRNGPEWYGFKESPKEGGHEAVKRELREGWQEGCALINKARAKVIDASLAAPANRRLRMQNGFVTGFNPNVPALIRGEPNAYSQWGRKPKVQAVRLICELVANGFRDAKSLVWRGAATLVIADLLQEAGYSVEIWATNTVSSGYNYEASCTAALVKGAEQTTIPDMLASVLVSPRYYRVGMLESPRAFSPEVREGYGQPLKLDLNELKGTELEDLTDGIYVGECFDITAAVAKINEVVKRINNNG